MLRDFVAGHYLYCTHAVNLYFNKLLFLQSLSRRTTFWQVWVPIADVVNLDQLATERFHIID